MNDARYYNLLIEFVWFKALAGGMLTAVFGVAAFFAFLVYRISQLPRPPGSNLGFSPQQWLSHSPAPLLLLLLFFTGFGLTWFASRR